ncbi:MAG: RDD family protein [Bdellovibrionales bacterium]|nr:RDD family protein [Bdellovibrionales bacterium]
MAAPELRLVPSLPPETKALQHTTQDLPQAVFAGFWIRGAAAVFDWFLGSLISNPMGYFVGQVTATAVLDGHLTADQAEALGSGFTLAFAVTLNLAYLGIMQGILGYTLGKKVFGLRVLNRDLGTPDWKKGILRYGAWVLGSLPLYAGFIWAAFDPKKRAFHDRVAKTSVVYADRFERALQALNQADIQRAQAASPEISDRLAA